MNIGSAFRKKKIKIFSLPGCVASVFGASHTFRDGSDFSLLRLPLAPAFSVSILFPALPSDPRGDSFWW